MDHVAETPDDLVCRWKWIVAWCDGVLDRRACAVESSIGKATRWAGRIRQKQATCIRRSIQDAEWFFRALTLRPGVPEVASRPEAGVTYDPSGNINVAATAALQAEYGGPVIEKTGFTSVAPVIGGLLGGMVSGAAPAAAAAEPVVAAVAAAVPTIPGIGDILNIILKEGVQLNSGLEALTKQARLIFESTLDKYHAR